MYEDDDELADKPAAGGIEDYIKAGEEADNRKSNVNLAGAIGDLLSNRQSFGNFYLGKMNPQNNAVSSFAKTVAGGISSPEERQKKAFEYIKSKRDIEKSQNAELGDSADSNAYRSQIESIMPGLKGKLDGMSLEQMEKVSPLLIQKIKGDVDRETAKIAADARSADRTEARNARAEDKALKQKELSTTQAKQRGLYEVGKTAEEQFTNATKDKNNYDPTAVGQVIDNSDWAPNWMKNNKAIEAQAAQSAWVEGFLRDASGAAIPPSERMSYAKDFFPQPGDSEDVVANKAVLRQQKMDNARTAAGIETGHGPTDKKERTVKKILRNKNTGDIKYLYSDGTEEVKKAASTAGN